jgi:hypothetical protein
MAAASTLKNGKITERWFIVLPQKRIHDPSPEGITQEKRVAQARAPALRSRDGRTTNAEVNF